MEETLPYLRHDGHNKFDTIFYLDVIEHVEDDKFELDTAYNLLKKNGKLIFEIGKNQMPNVTKFLKNNNFYINNIYKDIQSYPRVISSTKLF